MSNTPVQSVLIALDYDDTYTKDPDFWVAFIDMSKQRGHTVIGATMRCESESADMDPRYTQGIQVEYTCGRAKLATLAKRGIYPNIWIDDRPDWIVGDSYIDG
jgi:hypothetical protein